MAARFVWFTPFLCLCAQVFSADAVSALALQQRLIDVFEQNKGAIIRVKAAYAEPEIVDGEAKVTLRVGTGFFISREGHVLVSASRAAGANRVWIEHNGKSYAAEAIGHDRLTNISVLRVLEPPEEFSIINLDTSVGRPAPGSIAVSIACPLDFDPSPSLGMFTGVDRKLGNKVFPTEYIRTSISVDAGQGGCPVLDINGRFVGMSVASIPDLNGSYVLPVDALARVRDDLVFSGKIIHSWMGFEVAGRINSSNANEVILSRVVEDAPAAQAGMQVGDQLLSIGGRPIREVSDVPGAVFFTRANQFTSVVVLRDDEQIELSVKTLPRPEKEPEIKPEDDSQAESAASEDDSGEAAPSEQTE